MKYVTFCISFQPKCKISASRKLSLKVNTSWKLRIVTKFTLSLQREIINANYLYGPFSFKHVKILLLARAMEELEAEKTAREEAKVRYLGEKLPPLHLTGLTLDDLQVSHKNSRGNVNVKQSIQEYCSCTQAKSGCLFCRNSVSRFMQRSIWLMRSVMTVKSKSSRTTETYVTPQVTPDLNIKILKYTYIKKNNSFFTKSQKLCFPQ